MAGSRRATAIVENEQTKMEFSGTWNVGGGSYSSTTYKRSVTTTEYETVGLTEAQAASANDAANGITTDNVISRRRTGECFWTVTESEISYGDWEET